MFIYSNLLCEESVHLAVMLHHISLKMETFPLVSHLCSCWLCVVLMIHPPPKRYISDLSVTFLCFIFFWSNKILVFSFKAFVKTDFK